MSSIFHPQIGNINGKWICRYLKPGKETSFHIDAPDQETARWHAAIHLFPKVSRIETNPFSGWTQAFDGDTAVGDRFCVTRRL